MIYRFNQCTLDTEQYQLRLSDKIVSIEPLAFDLLAYLIEHRDRVVTREELLDNLWKGKVVTDVALGVRLKDVRKAVLDSGTKQEVIKTIHGRGYQFIANITESTAEKPTHIIEEILSQQDLKLPDKPSIAVLPFINMSGDAGQDYFADGMTDEIITALSRVPGLFVIANNSTRIYKERKVDIKDVGRDQGVRYVLEGGIRKAGDQVRVTVQLIDTDTGLHIWAERFQRKLDDIFTVQDEITHSIVIELQVKLVTGEYSRSIATSTNSVEAWELVMRAESLIDSNNRDEVIAAKQLLTSALELDNNYPAAWTNLGWVTGMNQFGNGVLIPRDQWD